MSPPVNALPLTLSDFEAYIVIMFLFSSSNGYISTLIMLASVVEPSLEPDEVDVRWLVSLFVSFGGWMKNTRLRAH